jgi:hypothetical protein
VPADAIIECDGEINADVIGKHILNWALDFDAFNKNVLGPTSKIALNAIRDGKPVSALENNGVTNGAAMRASPLGCLLPATRLEHFVEQVAQASSPTHKSDLAIAGAVVIAWAVSRAIDGESWQNIVDALPGIARYAQEMKTTTFSASLAARIELALKTVREANGIESASEQVYQLIGAGTSTIESVPAAIAMVELAEPTRTAAPSYAPIWAVIRTLLAPWRRPSAARSTACRRLIRRSKPNSTPSTSSTSAIIARNCCTSGSKGRAYEGICPTSRKSARHAPVTVLGAAVIDVIADAYALPWRGCDIELKQQGVNIGGCALNIAIALKRLGIAAQNALPVGHGVWADIIRNAMAKQDLHSAVEAETGDNGWCLALVEPDGERTFMSFSGVENQWQQRWLDALHVPQNSLVYLSGYQLAPCGELLTGWLEGLQDVTAFIDFGPHRGYS